MTTNSTKDHNRQLMGRVALTITVGCAAAGTVFLVSGGLKAIEQIDRVENTLAELSRYVADGHASIRGAVATPGSLGDDALARFDGGVERRVTRLRTLNTLLERQANTYWWTEPLREHVDVDRFEQDRRAYLEAVTTTATTPASGLAMGLRRFDLYAQKMFQTVERMRDSADTARARALVDVDGLVALAMGIGALLIAYLILHPVFGAAHHSAGAIPVRLPIGAPPLAFTHRQRTRWLPAGATAQGGR